MTENSQITANSLLTIAELASLLKVPKSTIYGWRHQRRTPLAIKVGRHVRFRLSDVQDWLASNEDDAA
jgi:excisionase family DNA binding protein